MTGRTIVFSFDGTGNEPSDAEGFKEDESISNVLKLHILLGGGLRDDQTDTKTVAEAPQVTHYYNGIGTRENGEDIPLVGWLVSRVSAIVNSAFAPTWADARRILNEAMADFKVLEPKPSDRIVLFGFSRGAALARRFASMLLKEDPERKIAFLGVFDTVAAMDGIHRRGERATSDVVFENGTVHERVERAVHILSLDEDRIAFEPTQMNCDDEHPGRITEIWFPGVHSDVGGGYWHDGLSDLSLSYMIDRCRACLGDHIRIRDPSDGDAIRDLLASQGEMLGCLDADDVLLHPTVVGVAHAHTEGLSTLYSKESRLVCVRRDDHPVPPEQYPALVHRSVKDRFDQVPEYRPPALRGRRFVLWLADGDRRKMQGIAGLRGELNG